MVKGGYLISIHLFLYSFNKYQSNACQVVAISVELVFPYLALRGLKPFLEFLQLLIRSPLVALRSVFRKTPTCSFLLLPALFDLKRTHSISDGRFWTDEGVSYYCTLSVCFLNISK